MKRLVSILITLILVLSFASCGSGKYIGIDKAKQTVVDDVGAAIEEVKFAFNDLVTDAKGDYYRIKFNKDGIDYVYDVDAMTGKIINKSSNTNNDETMSSTNNVVDDNVVTESRTSANNSDNLLNNNDDTMMNESVTSTTSM